MKFKTDEEIETQLKSLLQNLSTGFFSKNTVQVNENFRVLYNYCYNSTLIKTSKKYNEMILPVLFDIITAYPIFMPKMQPKLCNFFCKLVRKPKYRPDNLHFSIEKVLYLYKMLFCQKERLFIMRKVQSEYFDFFSQVRYFFSEDDAKYLIKNYFYRLGNSDALTLKSLMIICRFFPPKYFKMIINDLLVLLKNSTSHTHSNAIISFIAHCILYENSQYSQLVKLNEIKAASFEWFDWTPYLEIFFNYALLYLNPKVNINGINFSASFQQQSISVPGITDLYDFSLINYISRVITLLIVNGKQGDEVLKHFERLINILAPLFFTSSNLESVNQVKKEDFGNSSKLVIICNNNEIEFAIFIQLVISEFHKNNKKSLRKNSSSKSNDNSERTANANQHQIKEFVRIVLPIIQTAIFRSNQYIQKIILESIRYLAELDFKQVGQLLLEQSVENIIDIEMSHFSLTCIEIVKRLIPSIITNKHILTKTKDFFPKIIYSSIECLSNVDENIYIVGISILGTICQFVEADDKDDELTNDDIQKIDSCRKEIIQCLESTFDQFIEYTISHEEHSKDSNEIVMNESQMKPFYFSSYFMSFEDSFIQSKVPFLIDTIDESTDKCSISNVLYSLFDSKPILFESIIPKMLDRLDKAINDKDKKKKKYFSSILSKLCIFSPYFVPFINEIKKRVDILIEECTLNSFKCASSLLSFVRSFSFHNNLFLIKGNPPKIKGIIFNDTEKVSKKKWEWLGKQIEDLKLISFKLTDDFVIEQLNYCIQMLQKLEKIYFREDEINEINSKSNNFKIQKKIILAIQNFSGLFEPKGQFCDPLFKSFKNLTENTPGVTKIDLYIKQIEIIIRNMIFKGLQKYKDKSQKSFNSQKLQLFVQFADKYFFQFNNNVLINTIAIDTVMNFNAKFKEKGKKTILYKLTVPFSTSSLIKYLYIPEYDDEIIQLIYEICHTKIASVFESSINIISLFAGYSEKVYYEMAIKELKVLETKKKILPSSSSSSSNVNIESFDAEKNKQMTILNNDVLTEEQCITALSILTSTCSMKLCYENEYLTRIIKAMVNLKFDPKWNISKYLFTLANELMIIKNNYEVKDDQIWRDFINSIIPNTKKSKEINETDSEVDEFGKESFNPNKWMASNDILFMALDLITFQKPPVSPKFIKFLLNTCFNLYEPNRINCIIFLSNLFAKMKPHTNKIQVKEIPKNSFFDDRCTIYFTNVLKNQDLSPLFTIYEGSPKFDESDGFQPLREVVFEFFTSEKLSLLIDSIAFFLNDQSSNGTEEMSKQTTNLIIVFESFWKGLSMILGIKLIPLIKEKILDIALNKTGPLLLVLFSVFNGIWRSSKHWNKEDVDFLNSEFLIPILRIFFFNRNSADAFQMLESSSSSFCRRRDFRRLDWLFEFIMNSIDEISKSSETKESLSEEKENIISHLIDFASSLFYNFSDKSCSEKYVFYLNEKVLPAFGSPNKFDFNNNIMASVSSLAKFSCSLINTNLIDLKITTPNWSSIPFEKIFDIQYKSKRFDKLALFLIDLISPASLGLSCFIPFVSERFEQIFTLLSNLSTKFQKYGSHLILQIGLLHWEKYPNLLINTVLNKIKNIIIPSLTVIQHGWWIKCNIVTFLHVICFRYLFVLPIETYEIIMKEILPLLICDKNENVRESSMNLLIFLVNVVYCGKFDILSKEVLAAFDKNKANSNNELMNEEFATATACALLCNMSTLMNSCPKWLPLIFNQLENAFFKGSSFKNVIQKSVKGFWTRHGVREIPDLEIYRFSLCESYYA